MPVLRSLGFFSSRLFKYISRRRRTLAFKMIIWTIVLWIKDGCQQIVWIWFFSVEGDDLKKTGEWKWWANTDRFIPRIQVNDDEDEPVIKNMIHGMQFQLLYWKNPTLVISQPNYKQCTEKHDKKEFFYGHY